jgi:hypothetical protein
MQAQKNLKFFGIFHKIPVAAKAYCVGGIQVLGTDGMIE